MILCIAELAACETKNQLKFNREQSEAIVFFPVKQQKVRNCAAHIITSTRKYLTPVLQHLHWLPVRLLLIYEVLYICLLCYNWCGTGLPAELISYCPINRKLRSASLPALLFIPASKTSHMVITVLLFAQTFYRTI